MGRLQVPRTWSARELADDLGVKPNGLYYHLALLEEAGLVEVVGTRPAGRMLERLYRGTGHRPTDWSEASDPTDQVALHAARLDAAKADVEEAVFERAEQLQSGEAATSVHLLMASVNTTRAEVDEFGRRLIGLVEEYLDRSGAALEVARPEDNQILRFTAAVTGRVLPAWWTPDQPSKPRRKRPQQSKG